MCALSCVALAVTLTACGQPPRQDEDERSGTYTVEVERARFPESQRLAKQEEFELTVRNTDTKTIPNITVTVDSFSEDSRQPGLADPERPVWVIDSGPRGGTTAYVNTWALGKLRAGGRKTFRWRVTPVQAGTHEVRWKIAAGLDGKARARVAGGRSPEGSFDVRVAREPTQSRVDPDTERIVPES